MTWRPADDTNAARARASQEQAYQVRRFTLPDARTDAAAACARRAEEYRALAALKVQLELRGVAASWPGAATRDVPPDVAARPHDARRHVLAGVRRVSPVLIAAIGHWSYLLSISLDGQYYMRDHGRRLALVTPQPDDGAEVAACRLTRLAAAARPGPRHGCVSCTGWGR